MTPSITDHTAGQARANTHYAWSWSHITWTAPVSRRTAIPRNSHHLMCLLESPLSGYCSVCVNYSNELQRMAEQELRMESVSNLIDIYHKDSIQVLNLHGFLYILFVHFKLYFWYWWKKLFILGPTFGDTKSLGTKQTQVKPNANRGCPIELTSQIQPQVTIFVPKILQEPHLKKCKWVIAW